jgi:nitroreductase
MYGIDRKWHHHRRRRGNEAFVTREEALVPSMIDTPDLSVMAKLLSKRFGCRGFQPNPVARSIIHRIVTLAQLTASWCNSQPWQVVITEGAGTERFRRALFDHATAQPAAAPAQFDFPGPQYSGAYKERRREVGWQLYQSVGVARGDRVGAARQTLENFRLFGAPHVAIISTDRDLGVYGAIDCGAYVSNFALLAQSLGVASIPQAALAHYSPFVRQYFDLGEDRQIVCGISFGYEDASHAANQFRTGRANPDEAVTRVVG